MPVITVQGVANLTVDEAIRWKKRIADAVASVPELNITAREVAVAILSDADKHFDPTIVVRVGCFYKKPERTLEVQNRLARAIFNVVRSRAPGFPIEVFIEPLFDRETQGFWDATLELGMSQPAGVTVREKIAPAVEPSSARPPAVQHPLKDGSAAADGACRRACMGSLSEP